MELPVHGSNPKYVYHYFNQDMPEDVIDFSVNLNPLGPPWIIQEQWGRWLESIVDYPDPHGKRLTELLSKKEQIPETSILLGNGGAALTRQLANIFEKQKILLIQPTFSEYERTCKAYNCSITYFELEEGIWNLPWEELRIAIQQHDVVFFCQPNNPTGIVYDETVVYKLAKICEKSKTYLVLDEAFYDFAIKPMTLLPYLYHFEYLILMRSLTKMYAIAGLRLGYLVAHPHIIQALRKVQAYWSVNTIALLAGEAVLHEETHVQETRRFVESQRTVYFPLLRELGYELSNSKVNYFLLRDPTFDQQTLLFKYLLNKGIVARHTVNYPGLRGRWLRFSIRKDKDMQLLQKALVAWKTN